MAIPETMKAYLLTGFGGFENLSYREDIAVPFPESNEVLVKVEPVVLITQTSGLVSVLTVVLSMIQINQDGEGGHFTFHVFKVQISLAV